MSFEFYLALRYLKTRRHGFFALLTTLIAIGGVTLGVAALIVTLAVMSGFRTDIRDKTLGIQPHVILFGTEKDSQITLDSISDKIKTLKEVESVAPFILGQTLIKSNRNSQGIVLRGILPEKEFAVTQSRKTLITGSWHGLETRESSEQPLQKSTSGKNAGGEALSSFRANEEKFLVLGKELARNMGVNLGDEILAFSPTETAVLGAMGNVPKIERFVVGGIFQSGMYEYDANMAFISFRHAQNFFGIRGATGLGIKTTDLEKADEVASKVSEVTGTQYWTRSWQSMNRNLFEALKLEKIVMTIILTMIILVASFTIISNLILMSIEKIKDIGILRALGSSQKSIRKIFFYAGISLGTAGIFLGTVIGITIVKILDKTQWIKLPQDVYYIDTLPVKLSGLDISIVLIAALLITIVAAVYPAVQAARVNPADAIRYG